MKYFKWTEEAKEKFIQMYPTASMEEMMKEFPIGKKTIVTMACKLKVKRQNTANAKYTENEDKILLDGIHTHKPVSRPPVFKTGRRPIITSFQYTSIHNTLRFYIRYIIKYINLSIILNIL